MLNLLSHLFSLYFRYLKTKGIKFGEHLISRLKKKHYAATEFRDFVIFEFFTRIYFGDFGKIKTQKAFKMFYMIEIVYLIFTLKLPCCNI